MVMNKSWRVIVFILLLVVGLIIFLNFWIYNISNLFVGRVTDYGDDFSDDSSGDSSDDSSRDGEISVVEEGVEEGIGEVVGEVEGDVEEGVEGSVELKVERDLKDVNEYYFMELFYANGEFDLVGWSVEKGKVPSVEHEVDKEYELQLLSFEGEVLYSYLFGNPGLVFSDGEEEGGVIEFDNRVFYVLVPKFEDAYGVRVVRGGEVIVANWLLG